MDRIAAARTDQFVAQRGGLALRPLGGNMGLAALLVFAALVLAGHLSAAQPLQGPTSDQDAAGIERAAEATQSLFVPNRGQTDAEVRYYATGAESSVYFTDRKTVLSLTRGDRGAALELRFQGANPEATLEAHGRTATRMSYITGGRAESQTGLPTYREVVYRDLWPGIDAAFTIGSSGLKYEFRLAPGARASDIRLSYAGAQGMALAPTGDLRVRTAVGTVTDSRPRSFQRIGGQRVPVASRYALAGDKTVGVRLSAYDPRHPLVIDPELSYLTLLGGSAADGASGIAADGTGAAYVTGHTSSPDFPTTPGAFSRTKGADDDAFVTKLNPHGSGLVYSTLIGGSTGNFGTANEVGESIAVDAHGNAYVTGITYSTDFPTTVGAYDRSFNGGFEDVFALKLSPDGSRVVYSTYLGGAQFDVAHGIEVDAAGHAFIGGYTDSPEYPTTPGAYDRIINSDGGGGLEDSFVTKLTADGSDLVYSTFVGGEEIDEERDLAIDAQGNAYITGYTFSHSYPTTPGALDTTDDVSIDAFVTKVNASGSALAYSTYLGGNGPNDYGLAITADSAGHAFVTGQTGSSNFPLSPDAYDTDPNIVDPFITQLDTAGANVVRSTLLGGTEYYEAGLAIGVDAAGNVYVAGSTSAEDFPTTPDAYDRTYNGRFDDVFFAQLDPSLSHLLYSTYIGGVGGSGSFDRPFSLDLDGRGGVYFAGLTESSDFPTTEHAFDRTFEGSSEGFAAKFSFAAGTPCHTSGGGRITARNGDRATFNINAKVSTAHAAKGKADYTDHGPAQPLDVRSHSVSSLICDGGHATLLGTASLGGGGSTTFRIELVDRGEPGRDDTYRILLGNGYDSGTQTLAGGNIQVR